MRGERTHQHQLPMGLTKSLEVHAGHRGRSQRGPTRKPTRRPSSEPTTLLWYRAEGLGLATVDSRGAGRPPVTPQRLTTCHQPRTR